MRNLVPRILILLAVFTYAVLRAAAEHAPTHNAAGGYIDACGEKAGMVGDDC